MTTRVREELERAALTYAVIDQAYNRAWDAWHAAYPEEYAASMNGADSLSLPQFMRQVDPVLALLTSATKTLKDAARTYLSELQPMAVTITVPCSEPDEPRKFSKDEQAAIDAYNAGEDVRVPDYRRFPLPSEAGE